jgi:hypothetical protein
MTMEDPVKAMKFEWRQNGTEKDWANFRYVLEGRARDPEFVKSGSRSMSRRVGPGACQGELFVGRLPK